jgi:hypothetical protein
VPRDAIETTTMPHACFGDPDCCGCLAGLTEGDRADIVCNECSTVILSVPAPSLRGTLDGLELSLEVATAICPHCGVVNLLSGFSRVIAFTCRECGRGAEPPTDPPGRPFALG